MATKLYLHREGVGTLPTGTLPSSEQSTLTADANLFDNEDGSENRSMNTTVSGSAQTSLTNTSTGDTNAHNYYIARWVSPVLNQTSVSANTWTVEFAASEGNAAANFPRSGAGVMYVNAYVWKPSNGTKYGTILDGNSNADGEEAGTTQTVISYTFSGAAVNSLTSGDACIVFEMWAQVTQANGTARAQTVFYDGTTENSTSNEAAFISTPENLSFSTAYTRSIATETVSTSDSLGRTYNAIRKPSTSLSFDGNEDRANLGNHSGLWSQALSKFSFSCWIYAKTISNSSFRSVFIHAPSGFANATDCYINSASTLYFDMNDTGAAHLATATNSAFNTTNKWYHIVGTYDNSLAQNSRIQLYVDNVVGTSNDNGSFSPNGSADMLLGDDDQAASATTSWDGYIKDFRWFNNKVLTSQERLDIRNNNSSAPTPDYWLPMAEGTGTPVDVIGRKTTSFVNNTTWANESPLSAWSGKQVDYIYDIFGRISKESKFLYDIAARISKEAKFLYDIIARVSKELIAKYDIFVRVTKENIFLYDILASLERISKEATFLYDIIGRISKENKFLYDIIGRISKELTALYDIIARVSKENKFLYDIFQYVSKEAKFIYDIFVRVTKENKFLYDIFERISKENKFLYDIFGRISKELTSLYDIIGRVVKENTFLYDITGRISKELTSLYDIFERVTKENKFFYDIFGRISKESKFLYDIIARISKEFIAKYDIFQYVSKEAKFIYDIFARVSKENKFLYDILSTLDRISKEATFLYDIIGRATKETIFKYDIYQRVSKEFSALYDILVRISKEIIFKYDIFGRISKELTALYDIFARVTKENKFLYDIFGRISNEIRFRYNIFTLLLSRVSVEFSFLYNIFNEPKPVGNRPPSGNVFRKRYEKQLKKWRETWKVDWKAEFEKTMKKQRDKYMK